MFGSCGGFRFGVRIIYGTAVFIKSVFLASFILSNILQITAVTLNHVNKIFSVNLYKARLNAFSDEQDLC